MDTPNDFRIGLAEKGLAELEKSLINIRLHRRKELVNEVSRMKSEIQIIKYSYMPFEELSEFESVVRISRIARAAMEKVHEAERDFHQVNSRFWLDYLASLPELFRRGEISRVYEAVRYFSGEIVHSVRMEENLWLCSFDCGHRMDVVTNSQEFKAGNMAVVCYLPPRRFGDAISEGMFVLGQTEKRGELSHREILEIKDRLGEVEAVLLEIL